MPKLRAKYDNPDFQYISWNNEAKIEEGIREVSEGGTDPSDVFKILNKHFRYQPLHVHLITDGDIFGFKYENLRLLKRHDKFDIYYVGDGSHNIEFYQKVKEELGDRCNVYVNNTHIQLLTDTRDGEFTLTEEEQCEILTHDYTKEDTPESFNKLMATITTYGKNERWKEVIRKTLASLVRKSKGSSFKSF
jgi:hypothetical protein